MEKILTSGIQENHQEIITDLEMQRLIDTYGTDLLRLCTLYLKDRYLAEDAVQETFLKVWKKYDTYEGRSQEKTWLTRIAINVCKNIMRTSWMKRTEPKDILDVVEYRPNQYKQMDEAIDLMNAILQLKNNYRQALCLFYYEEFSVKEIAKIMGKKESTVLSLLKRGREQLKRKLRVDYMKGDIYEI